MITFNVSKFSTKFWKFIRTKDGEKLKITRSDYELELNKKYHDSQFIAKIERKITTVEFIVDS